VSVIHKLITSIWNIQELPDQWKKSIAVPIHKTGDLLNIMIEWCGLDWSGSG
jgi:hypothetical protein